MFTSCTCQSVSLIRPLRPWWITCLHKFTFPRSRLISETKLRGKYLAFFSLRFFFACFLDWYQNGIFKNVFLLEMAMFLALDSKKRSINVSGLFLSSPRSVSGSRFLSSGIKEKTLLSSSSPVGQSYRFSVFVSFSDTDVFSRFFNLSLPSHMIFPYPQVQR